MTIEISTPLRPHRRRLIAVVLAVAVISQTGCDAGDSTRDLLSDDNKVRQAAMAGLEGSGAGDAVDKLIVALGNEGQSAKAARALTEIGGPAIPALCAALDKPLLPSRAETFEADVEKRKHDAQIRARAIAVLGDIGSPECIPALIKALVLAADATLAWDYCMMGPAAEEALVRIGEPALDPLLTAYYEATDTAAFVRINGVLTRIAGRVGTDLIAERIRMDSPTGRGAVLYLGSTGGKYTDRLIALIEEPGPGPRYDAAFILMSTGGEAGRAAVDEFAAKVGARERARDYRATLRDGADKNVDMLLFLFAMYPTKEMADDLSESGNARLETAASMWKASQPSTTSD